MSGKKVGFLDAVAGVISLMVIAAPTAADSPRVVREIIGLSHESGLTETVDDGTGAHTLNIHQASYALRVYANGRTYDLPGSLILNIECKSDPAKANRHQLSVFIDYWNRKRTVRACILYGAPKGEGVQLCDPRDRPLGEGEDDEQSFRVEAPTNFLRDVLVLGRKHEDLHVVAHSRETDFINAYFDVSDLVAHFQEMAPYCQGVPISF
jgi:hypothetical protein